MTPTTPTELLDAAFALAAAEPNTWLTVSPENRDRINRIARNTINRACVRLVLACMLAKVHRAEIDPRRPYTEITEPDSFSGRSYDEGYISTLIQQHQLPANSTTAFLTPALRNINQTLTPEKVIVGRPRTLYADALQLLDQVAHGHEQANAVLTDTLRVLLLLQTEQRSQLETLRARLATTESPAELSSEGIVTLLQQHLASPGGSRLPVLIVVAAYRAVASLIGEVTKPLAAHTAADLQTGAAGDVEIRLSSDDRVRTVYEMKRKAVTIWDINRANEKIQHLTELDNYIFVTTDPIDLQVREYASAMYASTGGIEFAILDCLGFVRHFLHLFHRHRAAFLEQYQTLVLGEPDSAVSFALKQAFLALLAAAHSPEDTGA